MKNRIKAPVLALTAVVALAGCDLLDVNNPNSLVEESVHLPAAANGVANGSLTLVTEAVADLWEGPAVVSDELYWTGSRDAWGQLDNGAISDPLNEFTDGAFPSLGRAVWMAQEAVNILSDHVAEDPADEGFAKDLARAQMFNGLILMVVGESQEDMTFSNRMEDGPPVGPANMYTVLDNAITSLTAAIDGFTALGEDDLATTATALRARAHMSRAIWDVLNPSAPAAGSTPAALDFGAAAVADANAVLADVNGDWKYNLTYSATTASCDMCSNVNSRGENQWDLTLHANDGPGSSGREGFGVTLLDPISGSASPAATKALDQFGEDNYGAITVTSARLMRLILAETDLATGGGGGGSVFETQINTIRDLDNAGAGYDFVSGGGGMPTDMQMLMHARRANTIFQGLRLQDMYRWGLTDSKWLPNSAARLNPGTMLPITIIECRANKYLDNSCNPVSG